MDDLTETLVLANFVQILTSSAFIIIMWNLLSRLFSVLYDWLSLYFNTIKYEYCVDLASLNVDDRLLAGYLLVRNGSDAYIQNVASEKDKKHTELQNKKINTIIEHLRGSSSIKYNFNVHKRLGTQLKCFIEGPNRESLESVIKAITADDKLELDEVGQTVRTKKWIAWFIVKDFPKVESADGIRNNLIYPYCQNNSTLDDPHGDAGFAS